MSAARKPRQNSLITSTVYGGSLDRASVIVCLTDEKYLADRAELAEMHRTR